MLAPVPGTAAGFATKAVPLADPGETVGSVRQRVSGARFESAADVAVCDGERLVGLFGHTTGAARRAAEEPLLRRYLHRLPWLLVGLAGAVLAALIVGAFERRLEADVIVAFFVPGIVYLADAVGTQTEALVIRGLSVGADIRSTVPLIYRFGGDPAFGSGPLATVVQDLLPLVIYFAVAARLVG
jgi:magnesium transporter